MLKILGASNSPDGLLGLHCHQWIEKGKGKKEMRGKSWEEERKSLQKRNLGLNLKLYQTHTMYMAETSIMLFKNSGLELTYVAKFEDFFASKVSKVDWMYRFNPHE